MNLIGQIFEARVHSLLAHMSDHIEPEKILGHKKIDLYLERKELGKRRRYAVECKSFGKRLAINQVKNIAVDYHELISSNLVDVILLVTRKGLSPASQTFIDNSINYTHLTIEELQANVMNFDGYINYIIQDYENDGLHRYYVPSYATQLNEIKKINLDKLATNLTEREDNKSIAVLGGYGTGKTTFLRNLAYHQAKKYKKELSSRIPIFIRLGDICSEQSLEGLLGSLFTGKYLVNGYSFSLFQELNKSGAFLMLLDGFDEMKQNMTVDIFRYTFNQILRLVFPNSIVILSGRESAFLSKSERDEFLQAKVNKKGVCIHLSDKPRFNEVELCPFDNNRISEFIDNYRKYLISDKKIPINAVPEKEVFFSSPALRDISKRPVQLQMLFQVLPYYDGDLETLTVKELYFYFVDLIIQRESNKPARQRFQSEQRRDFICAVAWYMWAEKMTTIPINNVPVDEFLQSSKLMNIASSDSVRRDLVAGSCLDIKFPDNIFFPHRSIQEYLIAEYLLATLNGEEFHKKYSTLIGHDVTLQTLENDISPEIFDFFLVLIGDNDRANILKLLSKTQSKYSRRLFDIWLSSDHFMATIADDQNYSVSILSLLVLEAIEKQGEDIEQRKKMYNYALNYLKGGRVLNEIEYYHALRLNFILLFNETEEDVRNEYLSECCYLTQFFDPSSWFSANGTILKKVPGYIKRMQNVIGFHVPTKMYQIWQLEKIFHKAGYLGITEWYSLYNKYVKSQFPPVGRLKNEYAKHFEVDQQ